MNIGKVVDAIDWHTERFERFTKEAEAMQKKKWQPGYVVFVVFSDVSTISTKVANFYDFSYIASAASCAQILLEKQNTYPSFVKVTLLN